MELLTTLLGLIVLGTAIAVMVILLLYDMFKEY